MILPTKHIASDRALLTTGARILPCLSESLTVSAVWEELNRGCGVKEQQPVVSYDHFVLALDLLFIIGVVHLESGLLRRVSNDS